MFQIDAFARQVFSGNPAAVVPLRKWLPDGLLQAIARENNLSETAFLTPGEQPGQYNLRWFTPSQEVGLCGHATLAAGFVVFEKLDPARTSVQFHTAGGPLRVRKDSQGLLELNMPKTEPVPCEAPDALLRGLGVMPREVLETQGDPNFFAVYDSESDIQSIRPDLSLLETLRPHGVAVTARGEHADFVSRYFAPACGIPEDPVTGSTHCALVPYWANKLGRTNLHARQISARGGDLWCEARRDRVLIAGRAVKYFEGKIFIDQPEP